ncbi:hypothetical protein [Flammeovirga sp. SubArs3]|uniref:hypothetical protein n=1 Tax=Flammeovirga sp. SubArs3 TaxID=2995316 RepID=UPI00248C6295|nr:hypothetical protein [Flammeovirga sp. SubArs3]
MEPFNEEKLINYRLPKGITGFVESENKTIDLSLWEETVKSFFSIKANIQFSDRYSYTYQIIEFNNELYLLFKNKYTDFFAIAKVDDENEEYHKIPNHYFFDEFEIIDFLEAMGFIHYPTALLELKVDGANPLITNLLKELSDSEFGQFSYFEPKIIANIIFNDWKK